jgi:hypothetical protein
MSLPNGTPCDIIDAAMNYEVRETRSNRLISRGVGAWSLFRTLKKQDITGYQLWVIYPDKPAKLVDTT